MQMLISRKTVGPFIVSKGPPMRMVWGSQGPSKSCYNGSPGPCAGCDWLKKGCLVGKRLGTTGLEPYSLSLALSLVVGNHWPRALLPWASRGSVSGRALDFGLIGVSTCGFESHQGPFRSLTFPPVLRDWVINGFGMSSLVYVTGHIKDPVPLIEKSRGLSPGGQFPPSFIHQVIIITGLNKLYNRMFSP